jgi:hypothetical protein
MSREICLLHHFFAHYTLMVLTAYTCVGSCNNCYDNDGQCAVRIHKITHSGLFTFGVLFVTVRSTIAFLTNDGYSS